MKKIFTFSISFLSIFIASAQALTFHDYMAISMAGDTIHMSQYYGKKVMVVNCASFCTYTPQYTPLEQLYQDYQQYNFEIIGFPSDDFFNQGGTDSQIIHTCQSYGVTFLIMDKIHVATGNIDPIFQWLEKSNLNGVSNATVTWNFNKFLVDEAGHWVRHFTQSTDPLDTAIINWILSPSVISSVPSENTDEIFDVKSNPANSCINCTLKNTEPQRYSIKIFSNQGQLIQTVFDGIAAAQNISFPVSSLASGIYFINVQTKDAQKTFRYSVLE